MLKLMKRAARLVLGAYGWVLRNAADVEGSTTYDPYIRWIDRMRYELIRLPRMKN